MKNRLVLLALVLLGLLLAPVAQAAGEWNSHLDASGTVCTYVKSNTACYYLFTDDTDSDFITVSSPAGTTICLDALVASSAGAGEVQILFAVAGAAEATAIPLLGVTLSANHPACIFDVPVGEIGIKVTISPAGAAVVSVKGN